MINVWETSPLLKIWSSEEYTSHSERREVQSSLTSMFQPTLHDPINIGLYADWSTMHQVYGIKECNVGFFSSQFWYILDNACWPCHSAFKVTRIKRSSASYFVYYNIFTPIWILCNVKYILKNELCYNKRNNNELMT